MTAPGRLGGGSRNFVAEAGCLTQAAGVRSPNGGLPPSSPFRLPDGLGELASQYRVGEVDHCGQKIREGGRELIATVPAPPCGKADLRDGLIPVQDSLQRRELDAAVLGDRADCSPQCVDGDGVNAGEQYTSPKSRQRLFAVPRATA